MISPPMVGLKPGPAALLPPPRLRPYPVPAFFSRDNLWDANAARATPHKNIGGGVMYVTWSTVIGPPNL